MTREKALSTASYSARVLCSPSCGNRGRAHWISVATETRQPREAMARRRPENDIGKHLATALDPFPRVAYLPPTFGGRRVCQLLPGVDEGTSFTNKANASDCGTDAERPAYVEGNCVAHGCSPRLSRLFRRPSFQSLPEKNGVLCPPGTRLFWGLFFAPLRHEWQDEWATESLTTESKGDSNGEARERSHVGLISLSLVCRSNCAVLTARYREAPVFCRSGAQSCVVSARSLGYTGDP